MVKAVRHAEDSCFLSQFQWVLVMMHLNFCLFEFHSNEGTYFLNRVYYLLGRSDTGDGILTCRYYQMYIEVLLHRCFAAKAKFESTLDFVSWIAYQERDWDVFRIYSRLTVWIDFLELSIPDLGDRFERSIWRET